MNKVFMAVSEVISEKLTIFAKDSNEAFRLYYIWRDHYFPDAAFNEVNILHLAVGQLALQPQLLDAATSGLIGIGYFIDHQQGWFIAPPDDDVSFAIVPPHTDVIFYRFDDGDGEELLVFARTLEEAIGFYTVWNIEAYGDVGDGYQSVEQTSRWLLLGHKSTLRNDMDAGRVGVGSECEDGFWRIFPADYEPTLADLARQAKQRKE